MNHLVYFRCGADTSIKNNDGLTAEEILLKDRPDGWEENLHWYNKFKPGTFEDEQVAYLLIITGYVCNIVHEK